MRASTVGLASRFAQHKQFQQGDVILSRAKDLSIPHRQVSKFRKIPRGVGWLPLGMTRR